jgi:hypothetical protein
MPIGLGLVALFNGLRISEKGRVTIPTLIYKSTSIWSAKIESLCFQTRESMTHFRWWQLATRRAYLYKNFYAY